MFVGNLMALRQKNLYRLMAYSSIAHAGYMLVGWPSAMAGRSPAPRPCCSTGGVRPDDDRRVRTLQRGRARADRPLEFDDDLRGLNRAHPAVALLLAVCLFSLTGLPPTAGFLGKLNLFLAAWSDGSRIGRNLAVDHGAQRRDRRMVLLAAGRGDVSRSGDAA